MSENLSTFLLLPILIGLPVLIVRMEKRSRLVRLLSPMVICYLIGIGLGNIPGISWDSVSHLS